MRSPVSTLKALRLPEVVAMTGFVFIIPFLAGPQPVQLLELPLVSFGVALILHFTAIYAWNAWLGYEADLVNARLNQQRGLSRSEFQGIAICLSLLAISIYWASSGIQVATGGIVSILMWCIYSLPSVGLKEMPYAGTALHAVSGSLHGVMALVALDLQVATNLPLCFWFGTLFASGHLVHELIDLRADQEAGTMTAAVRYGSNAVLLPHVLLAVLLTLSAAFISSEHPTMLFFALASLIHASLAGRLWAEAVKSPIGENDRSTSISIGDAATTLQQRYRVVYLISGIAALAAKLS